MMTAAATAEDSRRRVAAGEILDPDEYVPSWWQGDEEASQAAKAFATFQRQTGGGASA